MKTLEIIFKSFQFVLLTMISLCSLLLVTALFVRCGVNAEAHRDYDYEQYCDSIWTNNPEYYNDVLVETDEYQEYLEVNGKWWE